MSVKTPVLPAYGSAASAAAYKADVESAIGALDQNLAMFAPFASSSPDMKINVSGGRLLTFGSLVYTADQASATLASPSVHPRIDRFGIDVVTGALVIITGIEAAIPLAPAVPWNVYLVGRVILSPGQVFITNYHLLDERPAAIGEGVGGDARYRNRLALTTPGTYGISHGADIPSSAKLMLLTIVGGGGGAGLAWWGNLINNSHGAGGGGGAATIEKLLVSAANLSLTVGAKGVTAGYLVVGTPDVQHGPATGTNGEASSVTVNGATITANGGTKGGDATTAANGAGGAGGTANATYGGIAGTAGSAGVTGDILDVNISGRGGKSGTSQHMGYTGGRNDLLGIIVGPYDDVNHCQDGRVTVEWF